MSYFDAKEFYDLSIKIANTYANQAGYRTAIGRAYYACHLVGVSATRNKGWFHPTYRATDHSGLCRKLKERGRNDIGDKLSELSRLREHADYHIESQGECLYCDNVPPDGDLVDTQTWQIAVTIAKNILPKLVAINPTKSR